MLLRGVPGLVAAGFGRQPACSLSFSTISISTRNFGCNRRWGIAAIASSSQSFVTPSSRLRNVTAAAVVIRCQARWCSSTNGDKPTSDPSASPDSALSSGASSSGSVVPNKDDPNAIVRVKRMPLTLIEEIPLPVKIMSEIELLMTAWCEEHARQYAVIMLFIRLAIFFMLTIIIYVFYRTQISAERTVRGVENMPEDLRIGNVVYFDITENGLDIGRVVIGLLTEQCPLYCEYFHRRCTGGGGKMDSFRGMKLAAMIPRHCMIFGDGHAMTHDVPGFNPNYLPTEATSGLYRGALTSIAVGPNKESPNFAIHMSAGDYKPQVFGLVIGGYDVIERVNSAGVKHGNTPKKEFIIAECGELCTLDKSFITPMPWKLYHNISHGYDIDKFGEMMSPDVLHATDMLTLAENNAPLAGGAMSSSSSRPWWRIW